MGWATWCWLGTASGSVPLVIWTDAVWGGGMRSWGGIGKAWRDRRAVCFGCGEGCWRVWKRAKASPLRAVGQPVCMTPLVCTLGTCLLTPTQRPNTFPLLAWVICECVVWRRAKFENAKVIQKCLLAQVSYFMTAEPRRTNNIVPNKWHQGNNA